MISLNKKRKLSKKIEVSNLVYNFSKYNDDPSLIEQHKKGAFYQKVFESVKKNGMTNPLLVVKSGDKYKVVIGTNRLIAIKELGMKNVDCIIVLPNHNTPKMLRAYQKEYYVDILD